MRVKLYYAGGERVLFMVGDENGAWLRQQIAKKFALPEADSVRLLVKVWPVYTYFYNTCM